MSKNGLLCALALICAMFLPRVVTEGQFLDGLTYASVSRNLALGYGSWWKPCAQAWAQEVFYEHPPFQFWAQSLLFRVFGDHWWIDKLYSTLALIAIIAAMRWVWGLLFLRSSAEKPLFWLVLILWYVTPTISWGMPCNMLESTLTPVCLVATGCCLVAQQRQQWAFLVLSGLLVFIGFLTKGPVALFPLVAPFAAALAFRAFHPHSVRFWVGLLLPGFVFLSALALLCLYEPARQFLGNYWQSQVVNSMNGTREMAEKDWTGHFFLIYAFFSAEGLPALGTAAVLYFLGKRKAALSGPVIFTGLIFLCATLPILVSIKQRSYYLMPAIPWLAMCLTGWIAPSALAIGSYFTANIQKVLRWVMVIAFIGITIWIAKNFGQPGRDAAMLKLIHQMKTVVPRGETFLVCLETSEDYQLSGYLQRYGYWGVDANARTPRFALVDKQRSNLPFETRLLQGGWVLRMESDNIYYLYENSNRPQQSQ
jgi:4-amino-4-deoxy-L-arabinose transferase-like glycosyltransferase